MTAVVEELESLSMEVLYSTWILLDVVTFFNDLKKVKRLSSLELNFHHDVCGRVLTRFELAWCCLPRLTCLKLSLNAAHVGAEWTLSLLKDLMGLKRLCSLELNFYPAVNAEVFKFLGDGLRKLV